MNHREEASLSGTAPVPSISRHGGHRHIYDSMPIMMSVDLPAPVETSDVRPRAGSIEVFESS